MLAIFEWYQLHYVWTFRAQSKLQRFECAWLGEEAAAPSFAARIDDPAGQVNKRPERYRFRNYWQMPSTSGSGPVSTMAFSDGCCPFVRRRG
jgi:hypothetical protein